MKKRAISAALGLAMACSLLTPATQAAQSTQIDYAAASTVLGLREKYALVGGTSDVKENMERVEEAYYASPVVADLDGDGKPEVLNAAYALTVADAATGAVKWQVNAGKDRSTAYQHMNNAGGAGKVVADVIAEDIDGDGKLEIIVGYANGQVSVLNNEGYFKSGWPKTPSTGKPVNALTTGDVDGDGKKEVIVGLGTESASDSIWVYRCDGSVLSGWPQTSDNHTPSKAGLVPGAGYGQGIYANGIATGDLNGDGRPEIIMPTDNPFLIAYHGDGSLVAASSVFADSELGIRPWGRVGVYEDYDEEIRCSNEGYGLDLAWESLAEKGRAGTYRAELGHSTAKYVDVDGDGVSEIVVSALMMDVTSYFQKMAFNWATLSDAKYMTVYIYNQDHTRYTNPAKGYDWTSIPTNLNSALGGPIKTADAGSMTCGVLPEPTCADLDGNGEMEIVLNSFDGKIHCFSLDGKEHGSWPYTLPQTDGNICELPTAAVCEDVNGDGKKEVIFATWTDTKNDQPVKADSRDSSSENTGVGGALYVLSHDGRLLTKITLHPAIYEYDAIHHTNSAYAAPTVADVDGDGEYEILVNTRYYGLCAYDVTPGTATQESVYAQPSAIKLCINGNVTYPVHAYKLVDRNGGTTNYVQIRELAKLLDYQFWDTRGKYGFFDVGWDQATRQILITNSQRYTVVGGETENRFVGYQTYTKRPISIIVDGRQTSVDGITLTDSKGGTSNYFQLRDLANQLGCYEVTGWDNNTKTVSVQMKQP